MYRVSTGSPFNFQGLSLDFQTVDAGAWAYFVTMRQQPLFTIERIAFTTGSTRYVLSMKDQPEIAAIELRAMGSTYTQTMLLLADRIHRMRPPAARGEFEGAMMRILQSFRSWLQADIQHFQVQAKHAEEDETTIHDFLASTDLATIVNSMPKPFGRPRTEIGQWAREQFDAGQSIPDIIDTYMLRADLDPNDSDERRRARDRLRNIKRGGK